MLWLLSGLSRRLRSPGAAVGGDLSLLGGALTSSRPSEDKWAELHQRSIAGFRDLVLGEVRALVGALTYGYQRCWSTVIQSRTSRMRRFETSLGTFGASSRTSVNHVHTAWSSVVSTH